MDLIAFHSTRGANGWLSNWDTKHPILDGGHKFPTAEHFLMFKKAEAFADREACRAVLLAKTAREAKVIGRKVKPWDEARWRSVREEIMLEVVQKKLASNPGLASKLSGTGERIIAEMSAKDRIWGTGMGASHPDANDPNKWPGTNLLGVAWMEARRRLSAQ